MRAKQLGLLRSELGEAPVWNAHREELSVVDIQNGLHHTFHFSNGTLVPKATFTASHKLGAAIPCDDGAYLYCQADGIWRVSEKQVREHVVSLPAPKATHRINDAKLGPDGQLWFGVMDLDASRGEGSLWRVSAAGQLTKLLDQLTIPNGMDWIDDEFWFVDGPRKAINCFTISEGMGLALKKSIPTSRTPDGLTIDSQGNIWVALWGGGRVVQLNREGEIQGQIFTTAPNTTSIAFIGSDLATAVMTSARHGMAREELAQYPNSGDLFIAENVGRGRFPNYVFG